VDFGASEVALTVADSFFGEYEPRAKK